MKTLIATIMRLSGLGDIYCAASIADSLKKEKNYSHIRLLCKPNYEFLAEQLPIFDDIHLCTDEKDIYIKQKHGREFSKIIGDFYHPTYKYQNVHIMEQMGITTDIEPNLNYRGFDFSDTFGLENRIVLNPTTGKYFSGVKKYKYWFDVVKMLEDKLQTKIYLVGEEYKEYSFIEQCKLVTHARLFIGAVSLFSHIAGHYNVPSVIINAGLEDNELAIYDNQMVINSKISCRPCYRRDCNQANKYKCQDMINPEQIVICCQDKLRGRNEKVVVCI